MAHKHMNMDPVVHFEMPAEDRKRMADFYANVFEKAYRVLSYVNRN